MSRWPQGNKNITRRPQALKEIREAREKTDAERRKLIERYKEIQSAADRERAAHAAALEAKRNRFAHLSVDDALTAARRLSFIDLEAEPKESRPLNRPTLALIERFLCALRDRSSIAVLQWPRGAQDVSILHPLAMLATLGSPREQKKDGYGWCPAVPDFRTLCYPWRGSGTGTLQRRVLVDRREITRHNQLHLTRELVREAEASCELRHLHITLGHLNQLKLRDATKPHLAHPTLGELYPTFGALGGEDARKVFGRALHELFGRVRHGAALDRLQDHRAELCRPANAPFAFFGICPRSNVKAALQHPAIAEGRTPDLCLLDLGSPGLNRLGLGWEAHVRKFLELLATMLPETPVLAVTHDIYVHRHCQYLLSDIGLAPRPAAGARPSSRVIVRSSEDCFAPDPEIGEVTDVQFRFHSAGGQGAAALRALSNAARESSDSVVAPYVTRTPLWPRYPQNENAVFLVKLATPGS